MKRLHLTWPRTRPCCLAGLGHFALLAVLLTPLGCDTPSESPKVTPTQEPRQEAQTDPQKATLPLNRSFLPSEALITLSSLELDAKAPCSHPLESLRPALKHIQVARETLDGITDRSGALELLAQLSSSLASTAKAIPVPSKTDELRRTSAELSAILADLAEAMQLAGNALKDDDKPASIAILRRIHNGVDNTRTTIEALVRQCAQ